MREGEEGERDFGGEGVGWVERNDIHRGHAKMVSIASLNPPYDFLGASGLYLPDCNSARPDVASLAAALSARSITARSRRVCGVLVDFIGLFMLWIDALLPTYVALSGESSFFRSMDTPNRPGFNSIAPTSCCVRWPRVLRLGSC